jgi:hypothetical protein
LNKLFRLWNNHILHVTIVALVATLIAAACSSTARAQTAPDIFHRDFGDTKCYYTINAATGDVGTLSCVK